MNSETQITTPRTILTLLVLAPIISQGVHQFWQGLTAGLLAPLGQLVFGGALPELHIGSVNVSMLIGSFLSCLITITVGTLMSFFILRLSWRIMARAFPEATEKRPE
jgi:hypothetical protein